MELCSEKSFLSALGDGPCRRMWEMLWVIVVMKGGQESAVEVKIENGEERIIRLSDSRVHHTKSQV
jgi:hypothetical protein